MMESKIKSEIEGVVIGSRTLPEYKFQILNFMNMLYNNINYPDNDYCMAIGVVIHNLKVEIRHARSCIDKEYYNYDRKVFMVIDTIFVNMRHLDWGKRKIKMLCNVLWLELLEELTKVLELKYEFNF